MFIGANQDAVLSAQQIGIPMQTALTYAPNTDGTRAAFGSMAKKVANYRASSEPSALHFNDSDREKQRKHSSKKAKVFEVKRQKFKKIRNSPI